MYPITINFKRNLKDISQKLKPLGSCHEPIRIKIMTLSKSISLELVSTGKFACTATKEDRTPVTDEEMGTLVEWGILALIKIMKEHGEDVSDLTEIEKGSAYETKETIKAFLTKFMEDKSNGKNYTQ